MRPFSKSIRDRPARSICSIVNIQTNFELLDATESSFEPDIIAATSRGVNTNICTRRNCTRVIVPTAASCMYFPVDAIPDSFNLSKLLLRETTRNSDKEIPISYYSTCSTQIKPNNYRFPIHFDKFFKIYNMDSWCGVK